MDISDDVIIFISKKLYLKKANRSHFADIIKTITMFIKISLNS